MFSLAGVWFASALIIASITPSWALAQSSDDTWTEPLNLSRSGIATNPAFVTDSDGLGHVIWQDDLGNHIYTRFDGDQWSAPVTTDLNRLFNLPAPDEPTGPDQISIYTGSNPLFISGSDQFILAFWITPDGKLFSSRVRSINFDKVAAWESGRLVTADAASFAVSLDSGGQLHLAYVRTIDIIGSPAGIYYTRSKDSRSWAVPVLLYESPYLRRLDEGQANLGIAAAGTEDPRRIYVTWDNRPRKQVFLAQSADSGDTWEQPKLIAGPVPNSGLAGAFNLRVGATQKSVVLVWQSGREANGLLPSCSQIYQSSSDGGATWSDPQPMIEDLLGCGQAIEFVTGLANSPEDPLYFMTESKNQVLLTAWNGLQWSPPQAQPILAGFEEPEIYTEVIYGCHRASLLGERLYIVGCDQGEGGDIWVTSRGIGSNTSWFEPPIWSQLAPVASNNFEIEAMELVSTDDGSFHAFFSQHQDPDIYYTYWNGELWSRVTAVLQLPDGEAGWPAIAAGPENELFLIVPNHRGALYFSRSTSGNASTESRWSPPTRLEIGHNGEIGSADIARDAAGTVFVAYSVPVNDDRGIYLVLSKDQGTTWSEPVQVFDGAAAGFDLVGAPALMTAANGIVHVIWKVQSIQGDGVPQPLSLFYAQSENGGQTFNDADLVVEEPVVWQEIVTDSKGNLHILWQPQDSLATVWDQVSLDGGNTWQYPQGLPDQGRLAAVTRDPAGDLHLVGVSPSALGHWLLDGSRWKSEAPLGLPLSLQQEESPVELLTAAVNRQGKMMIVLAESTGEGNNVGTTLLFSSRTLELPNRTAIQDDLTQTVLPPTLSPSTPTPQRSPTPASTVDSEPTNSQGQADRNETNSRISPFVTAIVASGALLLLSVLAVVIRRSARDKNS
jgi:hypothetical protein